MKNLIQRVRDWLIKKLGGYTQKEYDTINRIPYKVHNLIQDRGTEKIRIERVFDRFCFKRTWSEQEIRHLFAQDIAHTISQRKDFMSISQVISQAQAPLTTRVRAEIIVVKNSGGDYFGM